MRTLDYIIETLPKDHPKYVMWAYYLECLWQDSQDLDKLRDILKKILERNNHEV